MPGKSRMESQSALRAANGPLGRRITVTFRRGDRSEAVNPLTGRAGLNIIACGFSMSGQGPDSVPVINYRGMDSMYMKPAVAILACIGWLAPTVCIASGTAPAVGLHENTPRVVALTGIRLVQSPGKVLENATLVLRDGRVEAAGTGVTVPADAVARDLTGKTVYPAFIDLFTSYGVTKQAADAALAPGGRYWNNAVRPELRAEELLKPDPEAAGSFRKAGFAAVVTFPPEGVFRGGGALALLDENSPARTVLRTDVAQSVSFSRGSIADGPEGRAYPTSVMGAVALIRQALLDARWYGDAWKFHNSSSAVRTASETNLSLAALEPYARGQSPLVFESGDELGILRAAKIAREFGLEAWALTSGTEYRRAETVAGSGIGLIVPLTFPPAPDVSTRDLELQVSLRELKHWDAAPENPARLARAGAEIALTAHGLEKPEQFLDRLRTAVRRGLPAEAALAALTSVPAARLGLRSLLGSLEPGRIASFIVTEGDIFDDRGRLLETWVAGERFEIVTEPAADPRGEWRVRLDDGTAGTLRISGRPPALSAEAEAEGAKIKASIISLDKRLLSLAFPTDSLGIPGITRLSGLVEDGKIEGRGFWPDGREFAWSGERTGEGTGKADSLSKKDPGPALFGTVYPDGAFGREKAPEQPELLLVKNAVIWTCGPEGVIEGADMLVRKGKIERLGRGIEAPSGAVVVDAAGRHLTPGIIDAHSHLATAGGVNELSHAITAETRIGDVIDPDDITIYRQLAGGTTAALLIHGSANPIGGQTAMIKFRWGALPDEMIFEGETPAIKFALGENVKQNYLPDREARRYPRSRMGVEQFFVDSFRAAGDYRRQWTTWERESKKTPGLPPPRRVLRHEALLEVLDGKRQVQCHAYRQDEMLAMMRVAEREGFRIGMFIHALEGYKVADEMKRHGVMPTAFSDWWAFKFEVYDAIPYNGALMRERGLTVSFNSDDDELGRRLNLEAAKAVKYGGVPPHEALKFVTLNPAIQLGVADRLGSLEPGKDADFVLWSGDPLSVYSRCEQTWLDGRKYFDREQDRLARQIAGSQRAALVQKILGAGGEK